MKNFLRALRYVMPYRRRLALSILCAFLAAILWGLNFTAVYPVLKLLHSEVSPQQWIDGCIAKTQEEQIEKFAGLRRLLKEKGIDVGLIADEWCNTLPDIKLFAAAAASDFVQIKTPDLGSIHNTIEAVLFCKENGMGACLGGTANETDHSTRISCHMGLACRPDFMLSKPGLGVDEALMIQRNEMRRTLALLAAKRTGH